jgi:hypothetical protein
MQDETGSVRGKLEERRNELNRGVLEKTEGNVLQEEIEIKWKNNIKVDLEEINLENMD